MTWDPDGGLRVVLREEMVSVKAECGHYRCASAFLPPPLWTSFSRSLFMLPGQSLSVMCGDTVRRWRIIPIFRAATSCPSSSSSSSSSLSTSLTSQAWISLYHLSQPLFCHSASFAQREVWKVCVQSLCLHVWELQRVSAIVYICVYAC